MPNSTLATTRKRKTRADAKKENTAKDFEALARALDLVLNGDDAARVEQYKYFLKDPSRDWEETASSASYLLQMKNLDLPPWECPPCCSDGEGNDDCDKMARKLIQAGVSIYEPDPITALKG